MVQMIQSSARKDLHVFVVKCTKQ